MKIDLCELFGVEEGEEFKIKNAGGNQYIVIKSLYENLKNC